MLPPGLDFQVSFYRQKLSFRLDWGYRYRGWGMGLLGIRHPQHTQINSNSSMIAADNNKV